MTHAQDERLALSALLTELGPDKPTLCAGWKTGDLAAHLVLRERRPDAAAGVVGGPLAGYTRRIQTGLMRKTPFPKLVQTIKTGPPRLSVFRLPGADERLNFVEYFVHHEDVRRAQPGWQPRAISDDMSEELWSRLSLARLLLRKAPVGIELIRAGGHEGRVRMTAKAKTPVVTVTGSPAELTLWAMGRTSAANVTLDGSDPDVAALKSDNWRR